MLKRLAKNEGAKVKLLQILYDMWKDHPQMIVSSLTIISDSLTQTQNFLGGFDRQVHPSSNCRSSFSCTMDLFCGNVQQLPKIFCLGGEILDLSLGVLTLSKILHGTISKMKSHVDRVTDEYESIKSRLHQASIKLEEGLILF